MKSLRLFLFLLPFAYFPWANQQYELVKYVWFFVIGVGVWGIERAYTTWKKRGLDTTVFSEHKKWWIVFAVYIFFLLIQTAVFALSPHMSFWGTYQRHGGLLMFIALILFLLLLVTRSWTQEDKEKIYSTLIASGTGIAILALLQKLASVSLLHVPASIGNALAPVADLGFTMGRTFATMGHPNFLGQFLLITIILTAGMVYVKKAYKNLYYIIAILLQIAALLTTWNRASIIALAVITICVAMYALYKKYSSTYIKVAAGVVAIIVVGGALWSFFHTDTRSADTRLKLYPEVVRMVSQNPIVGYGLESFGYAFTPYFPKGIGETENFSDLPDKAHNEVLDVIAEQGIVGLVLLLTLTALLLVSVFKKQNRTNPFVITPALALLANELTNFASFSVVTHRVLFVLLLGLLLISLHKPKKIESKRLPFVIPTIILVSLAFMALGVRIFSGDVVYAQYKKTLDIQYYDAALQLSPPPYEYVLFGPANEIMIGHELLALAIKANPYDIYVQFAKASFEKAEGNLNASAASLKQAEKYCPNCPEVIYRQANLAYEMNEKEYFVDRADKYIQLLPQFVFENKEQIADSKIRERQRIFLKEQKDPILQILRNKETMAPLTSHELQLKANIQN